MDIQFLCLMAGMVFGAICAQLGVAVWFNLPNIRKCLFFHKWTKWVDVRGSGRDQERHCERCGKLDHRWVRW